MEEMSLTNNPGALFFTLRPPLAFTLPPMKKNYLTYLYLALSIPGAIVPMYFNFLTDWSFKEATPLQLIFAVPLLSSLVYDLLIAGTVGVIFMVAEGRRLRMAYWWLYPILTLMISLAFALPFFLFMREKHLEKRTAAALVPEGKM